MSKCKVACFKCGQRLDNAVQADGNQPYGGLEFATHGHYGSTLFDPMDGSYLAINICDPCVGMAREEGRVLFGRPMPKPERSKLVKWTRRA